MRLLLLSVFILSSLYTVTIAQSPDSIASVLISLDIDSVKPSITLRWKNQFNPSGYILSKRTFPSASFTTLAILNGDIISYEDTSIIKGNKYEYRIIRNSALGQGSGFIMGGIEALNFAQKGRVLIVTPQSLYSDIFFTLQEYINTLENDGWAVGLITLTPDETVQQVKNKIISYRNRHREDMRALFLLGNVPVPYSGNMAPDGHVPDHQGAWPADGYYADLDGFWTDFDVDINTAARIENRNIPGDGKFDQNQFPSSLELEIGRVDFSDLPIFNVSEDVLTSKYLLKNIAYRTGKIQSQYSGLIQNNFAAFQEGFGQSGLKNFVHLLGEENTEYGSYRERLLAQPSIWSYGCGPGSYTSVGGITTSANMVTDSLQTIFTMLFGSYFGDWDTNNNLLRSALASGTTLTNVWSGRPVWMFHHMGLGETIGYSSRLSMNNFNSEYGGTFQRFTHMALMGDPTLTMYPIPPVNSLTIEEIDSCVSLQWDFPEDIVKSFHIFRRELGQSHFEQITDQPIQVNYFCDFCAPPFKDYEYLVREYALKENVSGSFYQFGQGKRAMITTTNNIRPDINIETDLQDLTVKFINKSNNVKQHKWDFGDGNMSEEESPSHIFSQSGNYLVKYFASNSCFSDSSSYLIELLPNNRHIKQISENDFSVYPNPFENSVTLALNNPLFIKKISFFDWRGLTVFSYSLFDVVNSISIPIPLTLIPGVYLMKIESNEKVLFQKIIKHNK
jgi:PKD repeat protein